MKIGKLIKLYRVTHDMGVREMADEIGVSSATISRMENGSAPNCDTVLKLVAWLFGKEKKGVKWTKP